MRSINITKTCKSVIVKEKADKKSKFEQVGEMILSSQRIVCFTGAGASTDSGIPDYRGIGNTYWRKYNLKDFIFQEFMRSEESRREYWRMEQEFYELVKSVHPNQIHYVLAELEHMGKLDAIITQNVDGLHQRAGSSKDRVIEIHGAIFTVSCLQCYKKYSREDIYHRIKSGVAVPYCSFCYGILKSDTISFGQPMPQEASARALIATLKSDLFIVIGSSLLMQPASYLVIKAKEAGAKIIIINLAATPYDMYSDLVIYYNAEQALLKTMEKVSFKGKDACEDRNIL